MAFRAFSFRQQKSNKSVVNGAAALEARLGPHLAARSVLQIGPNQLGITLWVDYGATRIIWAVNLTCKWHTHTHPLNLCSCQFLVMWFIIYKGVMVIDRLTRPRLTADRWLKQNGWCLWNSPRDYWLVAHCAMLVCDTFPPWNLNGSLLRSCFAPVAWTNRPTVPGWSRFASVAVVRASNPPASTIRPTFSPNHSLESSLSSFEAEWNPPDIQHAAGKDSPCWTSRTDRFPSSRRPLSWRCISTKRISFLETH